MELGAGTPEWGPGGHLCEQGGYTTPHTCLTQMPQAALTSTCVSEFLQTKKARNQYKSGAGFFLNTQYSELVARSPEATRAEHSFTHPKTGQELADIPGVMLSTSEQGSSLLPPTQLCQRSCRKNARPKMQLHHGEGCT